MLNHINYEREDYASRLRQTGVKGSRRLLAASTLALSLVLSACSGHALSPNEVQATKTALATPAAKPGNERPAAATMIPKPGSEKALIPIEAVAAEPQQLVIPGRPLITRRLVLINDVADMDLVVKPTVLDALMDNPGLGIIFPPGVVPYTFMAAETFKEPGATQRAETRFNSQKSDLDMSYFSITGIRPSARKNGLGIYDSYREVFRRINSGDIDPRGVNAMMAEDIAVRFFTILVSASQNKNLPYNGLTPQQTALVKNSGLFSIPRMEAARMIDAVVRYP